MLVMKFGGTSVGSAENIKKVVSIITDEKRKIVVLSAMSGTTNSLVEIANFVKRDEKLKSQTVINQLEAHYLKTASELFDTQYFYLKTEESLKDLFKNLHNLSQNSYSLNLEKEIVSMGEIITTKMVSLYLEEQKYNVTLLNALSFMRIDKTGEPDYYYIKEQLQRELDLYNSCDLFITQGFICKNLGGEIDNLTRGGSDYTATIIGSVLNSSEVQIWSDKDGLLNNDPRYVNETYPIDEISYEESEELAFFGAKILHPTCIFPVKRTKIPVYLKNTMNVSAPGTLITDTVSDSGEIKAVAAKDGITAINIKSARMLNAYGFLRKIFEIFERYKTSVDMITTSEVAVSVTIDNTLALNDIKAELSEFCDVEIVENQSIVCIVGNIPAEKSGISTRIFSALSETPIRMISYGASNRNITILIDTDNKVSTLNNLNKNLFKHKLCLAAN